MGTRAAELVQLVRERRDDPSGSLHKDDTVNNVPSKSGAADDVPDSKCGGAPPTRNSLERFCRVAVWAILICAVILIIYTLATQTSLALVLFPRGPGGKCVSVVDELPPPMSCDHGPRPKICDCDFDCRCARGTHPLSMYHLERAE